MKRFFSNVAGAGGFSVAVAVLVVGLVAAVTSAQQDTSDTVQSDDITITTDSVVSDGSDEGGSSDLSTTEERLDVIEFRLDVLDELSSGLTDRLDDSDTALAKITSVVEALRTDVKVVRGDVTAMQDTVSGLGGKIAALRTAVDDLTTKTSKLGSDGNYTGPVEPSQLTRKLTTSEVSGQWPLDRTTGTLDIDNLGTPTFGCYGDGRYNVFMSVDVFGRYACVKVLK